MCLLCWENGKGMLQMGTSEIQKMNVCKQYRHIRKSLGTPLQYTPFHPPNSDRTSCRTTTSSRSSRPAPSCAWWRSAWHSLWLMYQYSTKNNKHENNSTTKQITAKQQITPSYVPVRCTYAFDGVTRNRDSMHAFVWMTQLYMTAT